MNADQFLKRVVFLAKNFGDYDMQDIIKLCLMDMDMSSDLCGFKHLTYCCVFSYENPDAMITKHIYPAAAKVFGCQSTDVEIAIRRTIEAAWRCRGERWLNYFPGSKRPTNGEFISTMVEVLAFWDTCRKSLIAKGVEERV